MFEFAKVYIRSLVAIVTVGVITCYGMYLNVLDTNVQAIALGVIATCVLFEKPATPKIL